MDSARFEKLSDTAWRIEPFGAMRVPAIIYASESLLNEMDDKVFAQATQVAMLPGIVQASYAMPDAHWGYGFPIGGVAAFDADAGGVVSAGGVGFDVSCGVRTHLTSLTRDEILAVQEELADALYAHVPVGVGAQGEIALSDQEMAAMLTGGARWAVEQGFGRAEDLERIEEQGCVAGADAGAVSDRAKERQREEMGTLGSGNHYLEVQEVRQIFDAKIAAGFGLEQGKCVVTIHCGSRGLGHQIGTEFLREMVVAAPAHGISPARPGARLRADPFGARPALSRRDARGDQLRLGQPRDHRPSGAAGVRPLLQAGRAAADVRRLAQHLQARDA